MAQVEACRAAARFTAVTLRSADCLVAILRLESMVADGEAAGKTNGILRLIGLRRAAGGTMAFAKLKKSRVTLIIRDVGKIFGRTG